MAREKAKAWSDRAAELGLESASRTKVEKTGAAGWVEIWHAGRTARGLTSARLSLGNWTRYIEPILGAKHPREWTGADFRKLAKTLDDKVVAGGIAWKSATNIWGTATRMARDAQKSKDVRLQCRDDNPSSGISGPDRGEKTAKQYLYPSEFSALVECEEVPLGWRRAFALAVYTYARLGELLALTWDDVDLEHGVIHITRAIDTVTGRTKTTKSKAPRPVAIEPNLLPLLCVMRQECGGRGLVVPFPTAEHYAPALREMLQRAGVKRASLFITGPSVKPIRFHDLRATGITWMAVRGDDPLRIQQRAGHSDFATTQIYIREAEVFRGGFGEPFPALPDGVLGEGIVTANRSAFSPEMTKGQRLCAGLPFSTVGHEGLEPTGKSENVDFPEDMGGVDSTTPLDDGAKCAIAGGRSIGSDRNVDPVERALATALEGATAAGEWSTVAQLGRELEARRTARLGVVDLATVRTKKGGQP
jgi:integrase